MNVLIKPSTTNMKLKYYCKFITEVFFTKIHIKLIKIYKNIVLVLFEMIILTKGLAEYLNVVQIRMCNKGFAGLVS